MTNNEIKKIKGVSIEIKQWIDKQQIVKEETLTDFLLYKISEKLLGKVLYREHTRRQEKFTGADWAWLIKCQQQLFYFRIQAKKSLLINRNVSVQSYCKGQCQRLIMNSARVGATPLYALYSNCGSKAKCCKSTKEGAYLSFVTGYSTINVKTNVFIGNAYHLSCFFKNLNLFCQCQQTSVAQFNQVEKDSLKILDCEKGKNYILKKWIDGETLTDKEKKDILHDLVGIVYTDMSQFNVIE